jgi:hypothetical protein
VDNIMDKEGNAAVSAALGAFRNIGTYDLALNYCQVDQQ